MAGTTRNFKRNYNQSNDPLEKMLVEELNALIDRFDALLAKLDADAGVSDTNYGSTIDDGSYAKLNSIEEGSP